eukprot:7956035-Prorocentrum_lima.AAC.1
MTSSLVGSEMCIRDRRCTIWQSWMPDVHLFAFPQHVEPSKVLAQPLALYCLLYTSDAADDM